jgi:pimeloyl-ACP methyl ester carboxylesterase
LAVNSDLLRTSDERFADLPAWDYAPKYALPLGDDGPRMAYVDEGPRDAPVTALCLHGNPTWGYLYRHMLPVFAAAGLRVVVPDLIGFGRSDKPAGEVWHSFDTHRRSLLALVESLDLTNVMLVCQDWGGILGLTLPMACPDRFTRLLVMNTTLATGSVTDGFRQWRDYSNSQPDLAVGKLLRRGRREMTEAEAAGYDAPFPDVRFKAALRAFPNLVPDGEHAPGAALSREAQAFWQQRWTGHSVMAVGALDPVLGPPTMLALQQQSRGCPPPVVVVEAGHFVPEWGAAIAQAALSQFALMSA